MTHAPASSLLTTKNDSLLDSVILNTIIECQERYSKEYSCQGVSFFKPMKWDLKCLPELMDLMGPTGPKGPHEPTGPHKPQGPTDPQGPQESTGLPISHGPTAP